MFVSTMAFHAKVSDPAIGGTYMTLLNTITNLAGTWISTLALWLVDNVSFKDCEGVTDLSLDCDTMQELKVKIIYYHLKIPAFLNFYIDTAIPFSHIIIPVHFMNDSLSLSVSLSPSQACQAAGGHCVTHLDGYYAEMVFCVLFGLFWYWWQKGKLKHLQSLPDSAWKASLTSRNLAPQNLHNHD